MVVCGGCSEEAGDAILCSECGLHYDYTCAGITEAKYRRLPKEKKRDWMCPTCTIKDPKTTFVPSPLPAASESTATVLSLDLIMKRLDSMAMQLEPLKNLEDIRSDVSHLKIAIGSIVGRIDEVERRVVAVEKQQGAAAELQVRVEALENSSEARDQWLRASNAELKGVPQKTNENLFEVLSRIGVVVSNAVARDKINFIARVPTREEGRIKPIIVSFNSRYDKENFVAAARAFGNLSVSDIGFGGKDRIFVNDHLTINQKQLLTLAKKLVKEKAYKFCWVKHGKIMVRRNETSPFIQIRSSNDLSKIK